MKENSIQILIMRKNYYPRVFLEKCRGIFTEREVARQMVDKLEISSELDGPDE